MNTMNRNNLYHHEHGGAPERSCNIDGRQLLDFSVNVSPLNPPVTTADLDSFNLHRYPSVDGRGVKDYYSGRFGLDKETVLPVNGAIEGIYLLPRALGVKRAVVLSPSFFDYERACRIAGADVQYLRLDERERFALPGIESMAEALGEADAFIAANPNNPTGTRFPKETFLALASRFPDKWFIMDEAFIQFADDFPGASMMQDVKALKNSIVISSLTKFYALPGLRLGAVLAHPEVIRLLLHHKEPWTVNAVAENVAKQLLDCQEYEREVRAVIAAERAKIFKQLGKIPGIVLKGYAANFFLAQWKGAADFDEFLRYLIEKNIYVRDCRNFPGLEKNHFRLAIRKPEDNDYLLEQLQLVGKRFEAPET